MVYVKFSIPNVMTDSEKEELYRNLDDNGRHILAERNIRLAIKIVNSFCNTGIEAEDLFQVAMIGLVKAANKFNPDLKYEFATFATPVIQREILMEIRKEKRRTHPTKSLNEIVFGSSDGSLCEFGDLIPGTFDMEEFLLLKSFDSTVLEMIDKKNERNKKIICLYLSGETQASIGHMIGVSQSHVSRIIKAFINQVRSEYMKE